MASSAPNSPYTVLPQILGKGSTGTVYLGCNRSTGKKVAIKVIDLSMIDNKVTKYLLQMQKIALMKLNNPYILKGYHVCQDIQMGKCMIVMELCQGVTLKRYIRDRGMLREETAVGIMRGVLDGVGCLLGNQVLHRDLKPANIMISNDLPKIIDFGYCEIGGYGKPNIDYNVGSPSYMSPQSFLSNTYNQKTQIWSIGIIFYECLTGKTLDSGQKMTDVYKKIQLHGIPFPDTVSQFCRDIVRWCLKMDPWERPTCRELVQVFGKWKGVNGGKVGGRKVEIDGGKMGVKMRLSMGAVGNRIQNKLILTEKTVDSEKSSTKIRMSISGNQIKDQNTIIPHSQTTTVIRGNSSLKTLLINNQQDEPKIYRYQQQNKHYQQYYQQDQYQPQQSHRVHPTQSVCEKYYQTKVQPQYFNIRQQNTFNQFPRKISQYQPAQPQKPTQNQPYQYYSQHHQPPQQHYPQTQHNLRIPRTQSILARRTNLGVQIQESPYQLPMPRPTVLLHERNNMRVERDRTLSLRI